MLAVGAAAHLFSFSCNTMHAAPLDIWRLWTTKGVYARVHECVPKWNNNKRKLSPDYCVHAELTGIRRAASLLHVDLPVRTFRYDYLNHVFSSGWLLHPDTVTSIAAFAHDAHSGSNYERSRVCRGASAHISQLYKGGGLYEESPQLLCAKRHPDARNAPRLLVEGVLLRVRQQDQSGAVDLLQKRYRRGVLRKPTLERLCRSREQPPTWCASHKPDGSRPAQE
jgi:hypothetical protein